MRRRVSGSQAQGSRKPKIGKGDDVQQRGLPAVQISVHVPDSQERTPISDQELIEALREGGSQRKAAAILGVKRNGHFIRRCQALARKGFSPEHDWTKVVPDGYRVKGVSTYYDEDGKPRGQWVKSGIDREAMASLMAEIVEGFKDELPKSKPVPKPKHTCKDLLNLYPVFDAHLGMLAWHEETGEDFDIEIAESLYNGWLTMAQIMAPKAHTGVLLLGGDLLHWDGLEAVTPQHKHILDADTRFPKVVRAAIRIVRRMIHGLLQANDHVHIVVLEGNHDESGSVWLREMLSSFYEKEKRVTVDSSPDVYTSYEWGNVSLFFHHGHKRKVSNITETFVSKFRDVFGRTKFSYAHVGHLHVGEMKENGMMTVEQHRTLTPKDAYASRGGWGSGRSASVITYHSEYGECSRISITPEMLK